VCRAGLVSFCATTAAPLATGKTQRGALTTHPQTHSLLALYRRLLRTHAAALPPPLRGLGDATVRSEWRAMVAAGEREDGRARPDEGAWARFAAEWSRYADALTAGGGGGAPVSGDLTPDQIEALSPDQRATLRRMAEAAGDLAKRTQG
jgi:hypothetical protein